MLQQVAMKTTAALLLLTAKWKHKVLNQMLTKVIPMEVSFYCIWLDSLFNVILPHVQPMLLPSTPPLTPLITTLQCSQIHSQLHKVGKLQLKASITKGTKTQPHFSSHANQLFFLKSWLIPRTTQ
jgi:hypothetical protein